MSLYGYPREPEATDDGTPPSAALPRRVTSEPVAVPSSPPVDVPSTGRLATDLPPFGQPPPTDERDEVLPASFPGPDAFAPPASFPAPDAFSQSAPYPAQVPPSTLTGPASVTGVASVPDVSASAAPGRASVADAGLSPAELADQSRHSIFDTPLPTPPESLASSWSGFLRAPEEPGSSGGTGVATMSGPETASTSGSAGPRPRAEPGARMGTANGSAATAAGAPAGTAIGASGGTAGGVWAGMAGGVAAGTAGGSSRGGVRAASITTGGTPAPVSVDDQIDAMLEQPEVPPWDRKPLMIVIAAGAVLVLIGILSGVASAAILPPAGSVTWHNGRPAPSATQPRGASVPGAGVANGDTVTLSGVGDVIMGSVGYGLPPNGGTGFFEPVKRALASDLVMGNLETPLTDDTGAGKCGTPPAEQCFQLYLPPSYKNPLHEAGFQVLNLANNHTNDMGAQGLANTRAALNSVGIKPTGGVGEITYLTVKGIQVAVLGFSVYSWGASLNNIPAAVDLVKKADAQADLVVIQMQGGAEGSDKTHVRPGHEIFLGEDRGDLIAFTHAVIDAGADVVFGHGPHIMRGMEFYKGRLIAYSLGNFCGYKVLSTTGYLGVGGVLRVTLHKDGTWADGGLVATELVNGGLVAPDPDKRALSFVAGLSREDFGANAARISLTDGSITAPAAA